MMGGHQARAFSHPFCRQEGQKGLSGICSAGIRGKHVRPGSPMPLVWVALCVLACNVRAYPRLGVLALPQCLGPGAAFPSCSTI